MQRIEWKKMCSYRSKTVIEYVINAEFQSHTTWEYVVFYQSRGAAEFNCLFHTFYYINLHPHYFVLHVDSERKNAEYFMDSGWILRVKESQYN